MRKANLTIIILLVVICVYPINLLGQNGEWQILSRTTILNKVSFFNQSNGVILGDRSYYTTSNGGESWSLPHYNANWVFKDFHPFESGKGYALSRRGQEDGILLRTTNCGNNWHEWGSLANGFSSIYFLDEQTGWVSSRKNYDFKVMKTTNSGFTWDSIFYSAYPDLINDIFFFNKDTGYVVTKKNIYSTTNGGVSWLSIVNTGVDFTKIEFLDFYTGWCVDYYSKILKTTNGGINWTSYNTPANLLDIMFVDENTGWGAVIGSSGLRGIHKTVNGGQNWIRQDTQIGQGSPINNILSIYMKDQSTGWASTHGGFTLKTTNGGEQWNLDLINFYWNGNIFFENESKGWITSGGNFYTTTNKGINWEYNSSIGTQHISDIVFMGNSGFAISGGYLFKTTNNGNSWDSNYFSDANLRKIQFANSQSGFITGNNGKLWKTINGGINWSLQTITGNPNFDKIEFVSPDTVYLSTDSNLIYNTTNGGLNWNKIVYPDSEFDITSIYFENHESGWITACKKIIVNPIGIPNFSNLIARTTNSGVTWDTVYFEEFPQQFLIGRMEDITFLNDTGFAITSYGKILKTTDRGDNWTHEALYANNNLFRIFKYDWKNIWILSRSMVLYKGNLNTIGVQTLSNQITSEFSLSQNYPNPFNPSTKIKFDIPKGSLVKLKIYDMIGREVAELVNEKLNPGSYEYEWNGMNLPSGVYFYKLESENFIETKRMVLVK